MDTNRLQELIQKINDGSASKEEKLEALLELNVLVAEFNKILKESLKENPE